MTLPLLRSLIPERILGIRRRFLHMARRHKHDKLTAFSEQRFAELLSGTLGMSQGGLYMIHSSLDSLKLDFPPLRVIHLLREVAGNDGTLLFLAASKANDEMDFLGGKNVFDRRRTPAGTGFLSEFARRLPGARRSLHPTKSVCAIGPLAEELTCGHELSPYPFDRTSPYGKFVEREGTVIGLGVTAFNLSIAHCVEDFLKDRFPLDKYLEPHTVVCLDYDGSPRPVTTLASNPDIRAAKTCMKFFNSYIHEDILSHHVVNGQDFFRCEAAPLIDTMLPLALKGITIYSP